VFADVFDAPSNYPRTELHYQPRPSIESHRLTGERPAVGVQMAKRRELITDLAHRKPEKPPQGAFRTPKLVPALMKTNWLILMATGTAHHIPIQ
jgi:hypothetical protein